MVDMRKTCKRYVIFTAVIYTCFYIILKIVKSSNKRIISTFTSVLGYVVIGLLL